MCEYWYSSDTLSPVLNLIYKENKTPEKIPHTKQEQNPENSYG